MGGFAGFDYGALETFFKAYDVPQSEWRIMLDKLTIITDVACIAWAPKEAPKK